MAIAFIPARGGSKSIPQKNIKNFCGKPLIFWNLLALQGAHAITKIVVATDSEKIAETVTSFGFANIEIYKRIPENATDTASTEAVMLEYLEKAHLPGNELFILLQATSPFTQAQDLQGALQLRETANADSVLSCARLKRFCWTDDGTPLNYDFKLRPRRQDFNGLMVENGAFYINTVTNIMNHHNRLSGKIAIYEMAEYSAVELDEEDDWLIAESLMRKHVLPNLVFSSDAEIKLFLCDVDGTLTDAGMYYDQNGNELKKFNTHDGKGFELLRNINIKTGMITSETTNIVKNRAKKLKADYLVQGKSYADKLSAAMEICEKEEISLNQVAYIGDDINCIDLLERVGLAACPANASGPVKELNGIIQLTRRGGDGAVREFIDHIINKNKTMKKS